MCDSTAAVGLHLLHKSFNQFPMFVQLCSNDAAEAETTSIYIYCNTNLPTGLNVDCAVICVYQEEALGVYMKQKHEGGVAADILSEKQRT